MDSKLQKVIDGMPAFEKRDDSTIEQFKDLERIAVKIGAYNAAGALERIINAHSRGSEPSKADIEARRRRYEKDTADLTARTDALKAGE